MVARRARSPRTTRAGLDLTVTERFARSMSLQDAMSSSNLLCYEMNGSQLPRDHGAPVRLIAPDWYGVANVKWLTRIEVTASRFQGKFMARDYVSIREENRGGRDVLDVHLGHPRTSQVRAGEGHAPRWQVHGAGRGLGSADREGGGPDRWRTLASDEARPYPVARAAARDTGRGRVEALDAELGNASAGEHTITSRAYDTDGNVQPTPKDPYLTSKRTFWENNGHMTRRVMIP